MPHCIGIEADVTRVDCLKKCRAGNSDGIFGVWAYRYSMILRNSFTEENIVGKSRNIRPVIVLHKFIWR
jgi:peroxiredoxin